MKNKSGADRVIHFSMRRYKHLLLFLQIGKNVNTTSYLFTFCSLGELEVAGQQTSSVFDIHHYGELYVSFGIAGNPWDDCSFHMISHVAISTSMYAV